MNYNSDWYERSEDIKLVDAEGKNADVCYETLKSAGVDLKANEDAVIPPHEHRVIGTGLYSILPSGVELQIRSRSGLAAKYGVSVLNSPGTVDPDFRGEIKVILMNHSPTLFHVKKGDRIAQGVLACYHRFDNVTVKGVVRGAGGFGSTGKA